MPIHGTPWHIETRYSSDYETKRDCPYYDGSSQFCSYYRASCLGIKLCEMQRDRNGLSMAENAAVWAATQDYKSEEQILFETAEKIGIPVSEWREYTLNFYLRIVERYRNNEYLPDIIEDEQQLLEYMTIVSSRRRKRLRRTLAMMYQGRSDIINIERVERLRYLLAEMLDIETPIHDLYVILVKQKSMPLKESLPYLHD